MFADRQIRRQLLHCKEGVALDIAHGWESVPRVVNACLDISVDADKIIVPLPQPAVNVYTDISINYEQETMMLESTATVGQVIGWNLRRRRIGRWTQPEFGRQLGRVLPKPWPAQTVSSAEKGERAFAAAELVAIAHLLEVPVAALFSPPLPVQSVTVTDELTVPAYALHYNAASQSRPVDAAGLLQSEAWAALGRIAKLRENIVEQTKQMEQESSALFSGLHEYKGSVGDQEAWHSQNNAAEPHVHVATANALAAEIDRLREEGAGASSPPKQTSNFEGIEHA